MISLEGTDIKNFDFESCMKKWSQIRKRRVFSGKAAAPSISISTQTVVN